MDIFKINNLRAAYTYFAFLFQALENFSVDENLETTKKLRDTIKVIETSQTKMPLPSGMYGNSLAVALEMQLYPAALFIIKNADELKVDLKQVSYDNDTIYDVNNVFGMSQLGFKSYGNYTQNLNYIKYEMDKVNAALEISELLKQLKEKTK